MLAPGTSMGGRYRLLERIASGGMGDVWKCEDDVLGRAVALKVVHPAMLEEPGFAERFRAEARVMATISHPGVVSVHDYGENQLPGGGTVAYLVMEYVAGESLHEVLVKAGRLTPARTMDLMAQAADALHAAHERGIIHRDVKPGNLLVRPNGTLVLTDFGIARSALSGNLTQTGAVIGTASYVSPEQALGHRSITPASDVYSLGVVAYQCLAGRRPFEGENLVDVAMKHIRDEPPPLPADVPAGVRAVIVRAMSKDVSARWPSAEAMADAASTAIRGGTDDEPTTAALAVSAATRQYEVSAGYDRFSRGSTGIPTTYGRLDDHHTRHQGRVDGYHDYNDVGGEPPRKRRTGLIAGLVVGALAVVLLLTVGPLADMFWPAPGGKSERNPASGPSADRPREPGPEGVPDRAMLQPTDLEFVQPGYRVERLRNPQSHRLGKLFGICGREHTIKPVAAGKPRELVHDDYPVSVIQFTGRYQKGEGRKFLTEVIRLSNVCREVSGDGGPGQLVFSDEGFAPKADASFVIRKLSRSGDAYHLFVRHGDVVSEIVMPTYGVTDKTAFAIGARAARNLCQATAC